MKDVIYLTCT